MSPTLILSLLPLLISGPALLPARAQALAPVSESASNGQTGASRSCSGSSPENLMQRMRSLHASGHGSATLACGSPSFRANRAADALIVSSMMLATLELTSAASPQVEGAPRVDAIRSRFEAIASRFGVAPALRSAQAELEELAWEGEIDMLPDASRRSIVSAVDPTAAEDLLEAIQRDVLAPLGLDRGPATDPLLQQSLPLEAVVIEGDEATGQIGMESVRFERIGGRWYFSGLTY